ncbi:MAG: hypothetical protein A3F09_00490 [Chlamydiae bacterium RIFCSPHIGHO2_12_FULL_49_11]|nr:MAG: hypothetical protein A3F09_00490 [Chlamydiae bacterium RIFCSPHIGHO2_12_FULL_49_11]
MIDDKDIEIRVMVEADRFFFIRWLLDPDVLRWYPMNNLKEIEDASRMWLTYARMGAAYTMLYKGEVAGMTLIYLSPYEKLKHQALFPIIVDEKQRGKGLGTKLMHYMMHEAKHTHGISLLHLEVYEGNPAKRLYERLGFTEYGRHLKFFKEEGGKYRDKILMEISLDGRT